MSFPRTDVLLTAMHLHRAGRLADAEVAYQRALASSPDHPDALRLLGALHLQLGQPDHAAPLLARAAALLPGSAEVHNNLGIALDRTDDLAAARAAYARAIALKPDYAEAHNNLGNALRKLGDPAAAAAAHRAALALRPADAVALQGLAAAALDAGDLPAALDHHRRVVALRPDLPAAHSDLLFWLLHSERADPATIFQEHLNWARRYEAPLAATCRRHDNDPDPDRPLRVGYVSPDFREHTRARFLEGVLAHHDPAAVEVYCYSDVRSPDAVTARFKHYAHAWRDTARLDHAALAELIRADRIDILVELTGHMAGNRLPAFARRPAPVQIAYPGYPATTGLRTIDHLLTDGDRDPPGAERFYTERLLRLDVTSQSYHPTDEDLPVAPLPALSAGHVTFASLNKPIKANEAVVDAWAALLTRVPRSRLMLLCPPGGAPRFENAFARRNIPADRLDLVPPRPRRDYLALHAGVDVNLDPWPYNGHTTLLDGLWMGVPAVTLEGQTHVSREGAAALRLVGLDDCIATTADDYVTRAAALAADLPRLSARRATLRGRMRQSPLCDAPALARRLEAAYRHAWHGWCARRSAKQKRPAPTGAGRPSSY